MFKTLAQRRVLLAFLAAGVTFSPLGTRGQAHPNTATESARLGQSLVAAARAQIGVTTRYDPRYLQIAYPSGDVPVKSGVCTDVVIRALRVVGMDLQQLIHDDMLEHFDAYPKRWGVKRPDAHIDHRRVPNQMTYFARRGWALTLLSTPDHRKLQPGDFIAWDLGAGQKHIGIVSDAFARDWLGRLARPLIIHNIADGVKEEDVLLEWPVIGHYRVRA